MRLPAGYCGLFLFALMLGIAYGGAQIFSDPDTAWHLAAGDLIRQLKYVPFEDPWSYASAGEIWYNLSWLFDIMFSKIFEVGGFSLIYVLTILAFSVSYVFMADHCLKRGASFAAISVTLILALLVSWGSLLARPNMASILFTVAFYHLLARYRDTGNVRYLIPLPVLMAFWVNMHGGFLLAFPIMAVFGAEAVLERNRRALRAYGAVVALCLAATALNPYGFGVYFGAYKTLSWGFDKLYIVEWQPAKIGHDVPYTLLLLAVLLTGDVFDKRVALSDRLLAILMLIMALSTMRHGAVAALLTMPYVSLRLTALLEKHPIGRNILAREIVVMADMQKTDVKWLGVIMACFAFGLIASPFPRDMVLKEPIGFPRKSFPLAEAMYIEKNYPHLRFMTDYNIGGYLDFIWRGSIKVFVDGRASSLYTKETLQDYADFVFEHHGFGGKSQMIVKQYGFEGLLIPNDDIGASDWHWNPQWRLVYQGDVAAVYLKADIDPVKAKKKTD